jgi:hypothetical protein
MEWRLLADIPFSLNEADFLAAMRIRPGSARETACRELMGRARTLARPQAVYLPKRIDGLDESGMMVGGLRFNSGLFKPRLQVGEDIYFFLATCGAEIGALSDNRRDDPLYGYWADRLAEQALRTAITALKEALRASISGKNLAAMHPGSADSWPLSEQQPLFKLLGEATAACGISLNQQCVMQPQKSVSGFYFRSALASQDCELCPRLRCPDRRAAFSGQA